MTREVRVPSLPPVPGETKQQARERRERNADRRQRWELMSDDRCTHCRMVRFHVTHEMDPENSAEGPKYHARFEHHAFVETDLSRKHAADYAQLVEEAEVPA